MENPQLQRSRYERIQLDRERERSYTHHQQHLRSSYHSPPPDAHSSATSPIGVPQSRHDVPRTNSFENGYPSSEMMSPIEHAARRQRGSIAFDSNMRTEEGRCFPLETRLPKPSAAVAPSQSKFEGQKIARESDFVGLGESFHRSNSSSSLFGRSRSTRMPRRNSAASKFLQQTSPIVIEGVASLTSDSTLSPMSEFHTPPLHDDPQEPYFSTHRHNDSYNDPVMSPGNMLPWSSPRKICTQTYGAPLSRSSSRGTRGSITSASPASLFLTSVNSPITSQTLEPDAEGQEIGAYVLGKQIGFGGFSTVKEAITIENNREIKRAVKIVRKCASDADLENDRIQAEFEHEVSLWRLLNHPRILKLTAVYDSPFATFAFMPLNTGGSLFDLIKLNRCGLPAHRAQRYSHHLASAIRYLHEDMRIVHADIKLENCLIDSTTDSLLLCDFGLAQFVTSSPLSCPQQTGQVTRPPTPPECHNVTGSLPYASPELIQASERYVAPCIDMWAFGCLVYALHVGVLPFTHAFPPKLQNMILKGHWDVEALRNCASLRELEEWRAESVVELVRGCLARNVARRWDVEHVLGSPWFEGCEEA